MKQLYKIVLLFVCMSAYAVDDVSVINGIALQADGRILLTGPQLLNDIK